MATSPVAFFSSESAPPNIAHSLSDSSEFINKHATRRICLVTSGGTTAPLERNTVRFIDNFSGGTRGAVSTEHFLAQGYAVIFLTRKSCLRPFSRHFPPQDTLERLAEGIELGLHPVLEQYKRVKELQLLLTVEFTSVSDYLFLLRGISQLLSPCEKRAIFYLAAAVSDFFVPAADLSEHKIQSRDSGGLVLNLSPTPKTVPLLSREWAPLALIITFKLETDSSLIITKAQKAFAETGPNHRVVIANLLTEARHKVTLVLSQDSAAREIHSTVGSSVSIEELIVKELTKIHCEYIAEPPSSH